MKIAIPTSQGQLALHFGHCEAFTFIDVDPDTQEILNTQASEAPPHQPGLLPAWLHDQGATMVIAGGMGMRAQQLFEQNNIKVVTGAPNGSPEEIVRDYLKGTLAVGENLCDH